MGDFDVGEANNSLPHFGDAPLLSQERKCWCPILFSAAFLMGHKANTVDMANKLMNLFDTVILSSLNLIMGKMKNHIIKIIIFTLAFVININASHAQSKHDKIDAALLAQAAKGEPVIALILFNEIEPQKIEELKTIDSTLSSLAKEDYAKALEIKQVYFNNLKSEVLAGNTKDQMEVLTNYTALPILHVKIHTAAQLEKLIRDPRISAINEILVAQKFLPESLPLIRQPQAATLGYTGAGTSVAVLDGGLDYTQSAFGSCTTNSSGQPTGVNCKVAYVQDFGGDDGQLDDDGHGTNVAGIVSGVAPGARLIGLDVFGPSGGSTNNIVSAINWCITNRATYNIVALNMSLGFQGDRNLNPVSTSGDAFGQATVQAVSAGIGVVAASGNDGFSNGISRPAAFTGVVSVGAVYDSNFGSSDGGVCFDATTAADRVTCFSNSAHYLSLLAPGADITAAGLTLGGTSMASPHVAGAWSVLKQKAPSATVTQVLSALQNTGVSVTDHRNSLTKPRMNLEAAVNVIGTPVNTLTLTIAGTGAGSVASTPSGISCSISCSVVFTVGQSVTMTATPNSSSTFAGWSGACEGSSTCTVSMSAARAVTATFTAKPLITALNLTDLSGVQANSDLANVLRYQVTVPAGAENLTISISGGTGDADLYVRKDSPPDYSTYHCRPYSTGNTESCSVNNAALTNLPNPPGVYHIMLNGFSAFSGVTLTVTYNADPTLSVVKVGNGTVTSSPAGISCDTDCTETLPVNSLVTLTATPGPRSWFVGWSGGKCVGSATTCAFTVTNNQTETATFRTESSITPILMLLLD